MTETDRKTLAEQIRAVDEASTVRIEAPAQVPAGSVFEVTVSVTGGAGPVAGARHCAKFSDVGGAKFSDVGR